MYNPCTIANSRTPCFIPGNQVNSNPPIIIVAADIIIILANSLPVCSATLIPLLAKINGPIIIPINNANFFAKPNNVSNGMFLAINAPIDIVKPQARIKTAKSLTPAIAVFIGSIPLNTAPIFLNIGNGINPIAPPSNLGHETASIIIATNNAVEPANCIAFFHLI